MSLLLDFAVGLLIIVGLILTAFVATPYLLVYMATPVVLYCLHIVGEILQQTDSGPEWARSHLHNIGVTSIAILLVMIGALVKPDPNRPAELHRQLVGDRFMRLTPWVVGSATAIGVMFELVVAALYGQELKSSGYSGRVDIGDILAYLLGFALVLANHFIIRPYVRRKASWQ